MIKVPLPSLSGLVRFWRKRREGRWQKRFLGDASRILEEVNRTYFRGRLPPQDLRILPDEHRSMLLGRCLDGTIELNPKLQGQALRWTVIHEAVHVATPEDGHGPRFRRVLRRIARREPLGRDNAFALEHRLYPDLLRDEIGRQADRNPWRSWSEVRRDLARRHRLTVADFSWCTAQLGLGHWWRRCTGNRSRYLRSLRFSGHTLSPSEERAIRRWLRQRRQPVPAWLKGRWYSR